MFGNSVQHLKVSTFRTWNFISKLSKLFWEKFYNISQNNMPRSRKRHHSRSRSKTRSRSPHSADRTNDRNKKINSHEKDGGKRRRLDEIVDSPIIKRSISSSNENEDASNEFASTIDLEQENVSSANESSKIMDVDLSIDAENKDVDSHDDDVELVNDGSTESEQNIILDAENKDVDSDNDVVLMNDGSMESDKNIVVTPKKPITPRQLGKKLESEKKKLQRQKEREEREKQRNEEKAKILADKEKKRLEKEAEKQKIVEERQKQLELKQKEKELKDEMKRKEREEKELKRKEKEELEALKRKEKEQEMLKKQQEKEKESKTAAFFKSFFKKSVAEKKKSDVKNEKVNSYFMPFKVKSDMKLPPQRRNPLTEDEINQLDTFMENQTENISYLTELKSDKFVGRYSSKTWPKDVEDDVTIVEADRVVGVQLYENNVIMQKMKAKYLHFHQNKRPPYFGTWRKKSKFIKPRRPFAEDADHFNYEEDSDDDWEEEEQGESLDVSGGDDDEKDTTNDEDEEYEVDNEFFVPHGHLSDDEMNDEENSPLSPEAHKQKLKLLKDEFEEDLKAKTQKLKPRSIGCIWFNKNGDNVEESIVKYLKPFAMIVQEPVEIIRDFNFSVPDKKKKDRPELSEECIKSFLQFAHENVQGKKIIVRDFLNTMEKENDLKMSISKASLFKLLHATCEYKRSKDNVKFKFSQWVVKDEFLNKYNIQVKNTV